MGILNITPDSFYRNSRFSEQDAILARAHQIIDEGGRIIDVGAYSSRPGALDVSEAEEISRLDRAFSVICKELPNAVLSVDTFRSSVARRVVENFGVDIINDISGGQLDGDMFKTVGNLRVTYVLMHMVGTPQNMQQNPHYENVTAEVSLYLSQQMAKLAYAGVTDVIIDPGFGFGKTLEHNYQLLNELGQLSLLGAPVLVGVSRKSMIYKLLAIEPEAALNGTTVINTIALQKGADILRVHDVKEAVECVKLVENLKKY
jgi:dihydropteroate synthase